MLLFRSQIKQPIIYWGKACSKLRNLGFP